MRLLCFVLLACGSKPITNDGNTFSIDIKDPIMTLGYDTLSHQDLLNAVNAINYIADCIFLDISNKKTNNFVLVLYSEKKVKEYFPENTVGVYSGDNIVYYVPDILNQKRPIAIAGSLILIHEIGHALGLQHTKDGIMNPVGFSLIATTSNLKDAAISLHKTLKDAKIDVCKGINI